MNDVTKLTRYQMRYLAKEANKDRIAAVATKFSTEGGEIARAIITNPAFALARHMRQLGSPTGYSACRTGTARSHHLPW